MEMIIAIAVLGGLGLVFGLVLAAASRVFAVEADPRLEQLNECLPGANCGGCGYAGCAAYAEAVLKGEAPIGACPSGGNECAQTMAAIMGVKAEPVTRRVALVRCSGARTYDADGNLIKGAKIKALSPANSAVWASEPVSKPVTTVPSVWKTAWRWWMRSCAWAVWPVPEPVPGI